MTNPTGPPAPPYSPYAVLLAYISITDTNTHTYLTDPLVPYSGSYYGIDIAQISRSYPSPSSYLIYILNNENQILTVQPIANIVDDGSYPDMNITLPSGATSITINPGDAGTLSFKFDDYPIEYISLYLSYATAPTSAPSSSHPFAVYALLYVYYTQ
ncbi:MAG: hypothetical protein QW046_03825 [Candidatus Micrarchaeaceae archaeon]